ncbi:MAG: 50S ribosomal protein L23 [archaeon]|jgi:large subunit ribosomal protein L23
MKDPYTIIKHPIATEKAVRMMESENKLIFMVDLKTNKTEIKNAIQEIFKTKVLKVTTTITPEGKKKAYVKLSPETPAIDIATQMGIM